MRRINWIDKRTKMTVINPTQNSGSVEEALPPQATPTTKLTGRNGHPLRRQGLTFVTHEVELKGPLGLPHWNSILERAGIKK